MAESVQEFVDATQRLVDKLHHEICDTAKRVALSGDGPFTGENDHPSQEAYESAQWADADELRKDLVAILLRALLADCGSLPTYNLNLVPEWARGSDVTPALDRGTNVSRI